MSGDLLNVLFVDDEQLILDGLRRQLHSRRAVWSMRFANSAEAALAMLDQRPADVIVTDMRMPGMTGAGLLARVRERSPLTTRIILSGQTDPADLLANIGYVHQFLQKPCGGDALFNAVERTRALAAKLNQPQLRAVANRVTALPPCGDTYRKLVDALGRPDASVAAVSKLVERDPAITVKLMQLVNSAFFGMPRRVTSAGEAVTLLGLKTVAGIVVTGRLFDVVADGLADDATISRIWQSSASIAESAATFAAANKADQTVIAHAGLAGLVSLVGRVILLSTTPDTYCRVVAMAESGNCTYDEAEAAVYGVTQDEVTAYALGLWGFADNLVEAVALQSRPDDLPDGRVNDLVSYLHLARAVHVPRARRMDLSPAMNSNFLARRGFANLIPQPTRADA